MLGDDAGKQAVKIMIKGTEITLKTLNELFQAFLNENERFGKQKINELNQKGKQLSSIKVNNAMLKGIEKEFQKFGVDFAVMKNPAEKGTHEIYFKAQDFEQIQNAVEHFAKKNINTEKRQNVEEAVIDAKEKADIHNAEIEHKSHEKTKQRNRDER